MTTLQQVSPRGAACARRRGRRRWTATPGRPRRGWITSSGARGNLWSRDVTAREAYGSRSRRAVLETETPGTATTRRRTRRRRRARCSVRCSRRKVAAGGSAGAGGRRRHRQRSRRSARCAWRSSARVTCWRTSPAPTASTGRAPCRGSRPPPAAPSAAPPSTSPPTKRADGDTPAPLAASATHLVCGAGSTCTYSYRAKATADGQTHTRGSGHGCHGSARDALCLQACGGGVAANCCCCGRVRRRARRSPVVLARETSVWCQCAERRGIAKAGCCSAGWAACCRVDYLVWE